MVATEQLEELAGTRVVAHCEIVDELLVEPGTRPAERDLHDVGR
jgi:hypothetical protein